MFRYPKTKGGCHPCDSRDVCRIEEGNTNSYIEDHRAIEEFLKLVEPRYDKAIKNLMRRNYTFDDILSVIGFCSYVAVCTPSSIRIGRSHIGAMVAEYAKILEQKGELPKAPESLGYNKFSEMIDEGVIHIDVDPKYPQAIGISTILERVAVWAQSDCQVLINQYEDLPFLTSDSPVALEISPGSPIIPRVVPLAPDLAIRIVPHFNAGRDYLEGVAKFSPVFRRISRGEVKQINKNIVRCAEASVFSSIRRKGIERLVAKNRNIFVFPDILLEREQKTRRVISSFRVGPRD